LAVIDTHRLAEAILGSASDAVIAADVEGVITFWNPGAVRIFGFAADEALGRPLDLIIPERLRERHWNGYRRVMDSGQTRYGEGELLAVPALTKGGARLSIEFTIVLLRDEQGRIEGIAALVRDVTGKFEELRALKQRLAGS
jgi:PAS domain S-box-containing protein